MTRVFAGIAVMTCLFVPAACAAIDGKTANSIDSDLGLVPIGGTPKDMSFFVSTDCGKLHQEFADCSAQDTQGRRYVFFDGALSKVSANKDEVAKTLRLPAGMTFGEEVESAANKVTTVFGIKLERGVSPEGRVVYSSDYVTKASTGIFYSVELSADNEGRLTEVIERTDF